MSVLIYGKYDIATMLLQFTRVLSVVSIVVILLFLFGEPFNPTRLSSSELLLMVFFPFSVIAGMIIAWWKESVGSAIAIAGLAAFYLAHVVISGKLPHGWAFLAFTSPAFLFLAHWMMTHRGMSRT